MKATVKISLGPEKKNNSHPYSMSEGTQSTFVIDQHGFEKTVGVIDRSNHTVFVYNNGVVLASFPLSLYESNNEAACRIYEIRKEQGYE